ncbi:MAG: DUF1345 domain-containing protein [Thermodesulfobacteriota bacterium]
MGMIKERLYQLIWNLNDPWRAGVCLPLGGVMYGIGLWCGWGWELSFLAGWILALGTYLILLGIVIFTADAANTRERISQVDPTRWFLLIVLSVVALLGNMSVAIILTAVGHRTEFHTRLFLTLSVVAVILSWLFLHTAYGQHYSRLYYEDTDRHGRPFPEGLRRGFNFPGTSEPTYLDFLYVSFTIGLTYAMSDVNVTNEVQRRAVLIHSVISFFFYSTVLGVVLNAILTS